MRYCLLFVVCLLRVGSVVLAQNQYTFTQTLPVGVSQIQLLRQVTSVVFRFEQSPRWSDCRLVANGDTLTLQPDPHAEVPQSQLIVFDKPLEKLEWLGHESPQTLLGVYAQPLYLPTYYRQFRVTADCEKPPVVPTSVWRAGLTPPKELPTATVVKFIIVHHEAGSNSPANFTNTVRNIYVFHTQTNGWNDVGYNFLIAQDGTVFEGRDGQGRMDGDNVQGAHFCGTNAQTMGVCLLGNYMTAQPPAAALLSLTKMVAWKMKKENLTDPSSNALHASSGKNLVLVSGHRDGCATDCPGNNLYDRMEQLRTEIANTCDGLRPVVTALHALPNTPTIFPNPSAGSFTFKTPQPIVELNVVDATGRILLQQRFQNPVFQYDFSLNQTGFFLINTVDNQNVKWSEQIVVR